MQKHVMGLLLRIVLVLLVSHFHLILVQLLIWFPELTLFHFGKSIRNCQSNPLRDKERHQNLCSNLRNWLQVHKRQEQQFTFTFCLAFVMASLNMSVETFTLPDKGLMLTHSAQTFFQKLPAGLSWSTVTKFSSSVRFVCWMKSTEVFTFFTFFNIFSHFTFGHFLSMSLRFCRTWHKSSSLKAITLCNRVSWCHLRIHVRDVSEDGKLHFLCLRPVEISTRAKPRAWCLSELRKSSEVL